MVLALAIALATIGVLLSVVAVVRIRRVVPPPVAWPGPHTTVPPLASYVVGALSQGVVVLDAAERVVLVNPAARAMSLVEVDRLAFPDVVEVAVQARVTRQQQSGVVRLPIGRLGREPIALHVDAVPLAVDDEAEPPVALLFTDMTEQRRLEAVRRDFVANVSHELKTPVGALNVLAEAIEDAADDPDTVARFAGRMQDEAHRLSRLVQDLMELSRVQGADPMPGRAEVQVTDLVTEAVGRARLAAEQKSIEIRISDSPARLVVRGDQTQLATALANLVDNAIAYSPPGTAVAVRAAAASDAQARPMVEISVADEGIGIAGEDVGRIFERFYRVDPARSRATGGTGLGLAIVRNIVTNHRGEVAVESTPGHGSTFTLRLPRVHSDRASSATQRAAGPGTVATRSGEGRE